MANSIWGDGGRRVTEGLGSAQALGSRTTYTRGGGQDKVEAERDAGEIADLVQRPTAAVALRLAELPLPP